jgi:hypothetical protein
MATTWSTLSDDAFASLGKSRSRSSGASSMTAYQSAGTALVILGILAPDPTSRAAMLSGTIACFVSYALIAILD